MNDLVGLRTRSRTVGSVVFTCPREGVRVEGRRLEVRDWHTVLGRPVLPSDAGDGLVECGSCAATYPLRVLDVRDELPLTRRLLWADMHRVVDAG